MGKRVATTTNAPAAKKEKMNPVFAEIQDALKQAEHLPSSCRSMLAAMVPGGFATSCETRSDQQVTVIQWMEDALKQSQLTMATETDAGSAALAEIEARKAVRVAEMQAAEAKLTAKKEELLRKKHGLAEATITMTATKKAVAEKQADQQLHDAEFLAMKKEGNGLAAAFVEHFKVPLEAGEALHFLELQPFLANLDLEESFLVSAPNSCCMTKEQRGSFDNVVVQALEQALLDRANQIRNAVSNQSPESQAREVAVSSAESQLAEQRAAQEKATGEASAAQKDVEAQTVATKEIEQVVASFDGELKAASDSHNKLQSFQNRFEQGPMAAFASSKDGIAAEACATAGA